MKFKIILLLISSYPLLASQNVLLNEQEISELNCLINNRPATPQEPTKPENPPKESRSANGLPFPCRIYTQFDYDCYKAANKYKIQKDLYPFLRTLYEERLKAWINSGNIDAKLAYLKSQKLT